MKKTKVEIADIFRARIDDFLKNNEIPLHKKKTIDAIIKCRTSALGGHVDACDECGTIRISYNSCRNRHCPKCQFLSKEKWLIKRTNELLPVQYFHVVFTIPDTLNLLMLNNQKEMYKIMFTAASKTVIDLSKDKFKAKAGMLAVLHTWGQNLMYHPHLHCIVLGGGLSENKEKWIHSKEKFFIHVNILAKVFCGKFLELLKKSYDKGKLNFNGDLEKYEDKNKFNDLIDELYYKRWVVFAKKPFGGPQQVLKYLGRYTHRIAISNKRILKFENNKVTFRWKDYKDQNKQKTMTLEADEFIRRYLLHILPSGFFKIRYYGLLSNRIRKEMIKLCKKILNVNEILGGIKKDWKELLFELTGMDIRKCPCCKKGNMVTIETRYPP